MDAARDGLPDLPGVPGVITKVTIVHGWAAAHGYLDVHEIADGQACRYRKACPQRESRQLPRDWDGTVATVKNPHVEGVIQNLRFCDTDAACDGSTPLSPRDDRHYLQVDYRAWDGTDQTVTVHADPEYGKDVASLAARTIVAMADFALAGDWPRDQLLVLHRRGAVMSIVMNAPLFLLPEYAGHERFALVVDGATEDALKLAVEERDDTRNLIVEVHGLRDGWVSRAVRVKLREGDVMRVPAAAFAWEAEPDTVTLGAAGPRHTTEREEWVFAYAKRTSLYDKSRIEIAPFLEGYELLEAPGVYVATDWLDPIARQMTTQDALFARPLPDSAAMERFLKGSPWSGKSHVGVGTHDDHRDVAMHTIHRTWQLEESGTYFLTEYLDETGCPSRGYSFDVERAHDYHLRFGYDEVPQLRNLMGVGTEDSLEQAMIGYLATHDIESLERCVRAVATSSMSF